MMAHPNVVHGDTRHSIADSWCCPICKHERRPYEHRERSQS